MTKQELLTITKPLISALNQSYIKITDGRGPRAIEIFGEGFFDQYKDKLPDSLQGFYSLTNGYSMYWEGKIPTRKKDEKQIERGIIDILGLEDLFEDYSVIELEENYGYYIKGEEVFSKTGQFIPVDSIGDICVGVFSKENNDDMMYYHDFGIGFYPLKVDFEGYLELVFMARGYMMWQDVLLYLEYGKNDPAMLGMSEYEDFVEDMPLLFPDFNMDEFIKLYESLKIK